MKNLTALSLAGTTSHFYVNLTNDRRLLLDLYPFVSGVYRNLERGGHVGVWGLAPSGVQGQRPGGGVRGPEAERFPLKLLVKLCNI